MYNEAIKQLNKIKIFLLFFYSYEKLIEFFPGDMLGLHKNGDLL